MEITGGKWKGKYDKKIFGKREKRVGGMEEEGKCKVPFLKEFLAQIEMEMKSWRYTDVKDKRERKGNAVERIIKK